MRMSPSQQRKLQLVHQRLPRKQPLGTRYFLLEILTLIHSRAKGAAKKPAKGGEDHEEESKPAKKSASKAAPKTGSKTGASKPGSKVAPKGKA